MVKAPLISVIIPCFNAASYIGSTLESVFAQTGVTLEVILVDDGSDDGSAELVESSFPGVVVYRTANNGPSAARNYGTDRSQGEFIQYLDADDLLVPGKLDSQLSMLLKSSAGVAYGDWIKFDVSGGTKIFGERFERQLGPSPDIDLFTGFWCPPAVYLIRRTVIELVGGWHQQLPVIQDARFMLDCALRGAKYVYCSGLMAEYRVHRTGSVSTRSRTAFLADCLRNACEIREWWDSKGQLDNARKRAVTGVLDMVASGSISLDKQLFDQVCCAMVLSVDEYPNEWPFKKRAAISLFGYRIAMMGAHRLRMVADPHHSECES